MIAPIRAIEIVPPGSHTILVQRADAEGRALAALVKGSDPHRLAEALSLEERKAKEAAQGLLVRDLGWSNEQAGEASARLASFEEDWNAPGMEDYDRL